VKLNKFTPQQVLTLSIGCLLLFQFAIIGCIGGLNIISTAPSINDDSPVSDENLLGDDSNIPLNDISYLEQNYQPYVESRLPEASYDEELGIWLKGDTGNHAKDGDFTYLLYGIIPIALPNSNAKTVDELVDMAVAEDLDFIGITNLDTVKIYMPDIGVPGVPSGDMVFNADLEAVRIAITRARYEHPELMTFYGVEKRVGAVTYFGAGQRVQCLLPMHPNQEQYWMEDLLGASDLPSILTKMESYEGLNRELGTNFFCLNDGILNTWSATEFQSLADSESVGGVVSVNGDTVQPFLEMSGPTPVDTAWDYYLNQNYDFFGSAASDLYVSGTGGPGYNCKTYVKTWSEGYPGVMEGFALGRVFGVQGDIINGMDFNIRDEYNNIAYMGDKIASYGNQTVTLKVDDTANIQNIKLITNNGGDVEVATTWTSQNWTDTGSQLTMTYVLPHSETPFFARVEGSDGNGHRFFSAPVSYEKSTRIFPVLTIINPPVDNYHVNTASFNLQWEKSPTLNSVKIKVTEGYFDFEQLSGPANYVSTSNNRVINLYEDNWSTIELFAEDSEGYSSYKVTHIYYHASFPVVNILSPVNNSYTNSEEVNITWNAFAATGYHIDNFSIWMDSGSHISILDPLTRSYVFSDVDQGDHDFYLQVFQDGNHENLTTHIYLDVDLEAPLIYSVTPENFTIYNENSPEKTAGKVVCNYLIYIGYGEIDRLEVDVWQNGVLKVTDTLEADVTHYDVDWDDGEFLVNITIYDKAGNYNSKWITLYIDYMDPQLNLNPLFYSTSHNAYVFWETYDTATWVDTVAITFEGNTEYFTSSKADHTFNVLADGVYSFSIWVNDSQGHTMERSSTFIVDSTPALFYTVWVEDRYFDEYSATFKIGMIARDDLSKLANVTLHYSIFTDPLHPYNGEIVKSGVDRSRFEIEIPLSQIDEKMNKVDWWCNITFYFECYNNVGMSSNTDTFEHQINFYVEPPGDTLPPFVVFAIIGGAIVAGVGTGFLIYKIKRRREFGSMAKYF
jgi:hypothetical protein